jgi:hypothetical protein
MLILKKSSFVAVLFSILSLSMLKASNEPLIVGHPKNISECIGGVSELKVTLKEGTKARFQWQKSTDKMQWVNIEKANEASYTPEANTPNKTYYRAAITVVGVNPQSIISEVAEVTIAEALSVNVVVASPNTTICLNEKLALKAITKGGAGDCKLQWQLSKDRENWENIEGENGEELVIQSKIEKNLLYRAKFKCSGSGCCD